VARRWACEHPASIWIDSDRRESTRIDTDRLRSTRIDSDRLGSIGHAGDGPAWVQSRRQRFATSDPTSARHLGWPVVAPAKPSHGPDRVVGSQARHRRLGITGSWADPLQTRPGHAGPRCGALESGAVGALT
jgi:hypothetical protein